MSRVGPSSTSTATSRRSKVDDAQEEAHEAREEARQTHEQSQQALAYMSTFMQVNTLDYCCCFDLTSLNTLQQLTSSLGPEVNLPPFRPPVFTSQQGQQVNILSLFVTFLASPIRIIC